VGPGPYLFSHRAIALALLELLDLTSLPIPITPIRHVQGFPYFD